MSTDSFSWAHLVGWAWLFFLLMRCTHLHWQTHHHHNNNNKKIDSKLSSGTNYLIYSIKYIYEHSKLLGYLFPKVINFFLGKIVVPFMPFEISLQKIHLSKFVTKKWQMKLYFMFYKTFSSWMVFCKLEFSLREFCNLWFIKEYASAIVSCSTARTPAYLF